MSTPTTRRDFLKTGTALTATALAAPSLNVLGANEKIVLGIIGPGGMGSNLLGSFVNMPDVEIAWVCDVDSNRMNVAAKGVEKFTNRLPKTTQDLRRILDDKSVDAVLIATPDHWHAPATILACDAGKHVYVEKPAAHNIREGRLMIETARRTKRIVQVGTQSRSAEHVQRAIQLLHEGAIGDILSAKVWNSQIRRNIGKAQPTTPPANLDYDTWIGPAPMLPYQPNFLHANWRWFFNFGTGDMGNDGVHDIDIGRWGLGVATHPSRICALGGKWFFDDDQQFPDTQTVLFEYHLPEGKRKQLIFEQRIWSPYVQEGHENGNAWYGTKGMLILGKGKGWELYGPRNELKEKMAATTQLGPSHHRNFLECIRSSKLPNADIEIGHLSASLCHLGNISVRMARELRFDPAKEQILNDPEANSLTRRQYRETHWAVPKGV
jgi:predicted dehydrogenase